MSPQTPGTSKKAITTRSPQPARFRGSLKSQKLQKPVSYLLEPVEGGKSMYIMSDKEKNVDGMASDYIRKVYKKIHNSESSAQKKTPNFSTYMQSPHIM